jgi:hypothetical protein
MFSFNFRGRVPKIRIETSSRVIPVLKTPVSEETSAMQKERIRSAVTRIVHRDRITPPQNVGVGFMSTNQINYVFTFLRATVLGTAAFHPTRATTVWSFYESGVFPL